MAVLSSKGFSVCFGDPNTAGSWRAWSAAANPRQVDSRERDRILKQRFGRSTGRAPMMNIPVEQVFDGKWPQHAPFYYDLTTLGDSIFAAMRLDSVQGVAADLFHPAKGYVGTVTLPQDRYLIGGFLSGFLLLDPQEGAVEFLGLRAR
jgi:hypothetical protein